MGKGLSFTVPSQLVGGVSGVNIGTFTSPNHMLQLLHLLGQFSVSRNLCISPNSFSYKGPYFKYRGDGSQNFLDLFWGGCGAGCRLRGRLMFSWWCVWVSVRRIFGFCFGGQQVSSM